DPRFRSVELNHVSPEFFSLLRIPIVRGRNFRVGEAGVAIATESTANRLWPNEDPLGKTLIQDGGAAFQIIGVARDAQVSHLGRSNETFLYLPSGPNDQIGAKWLVRSAVPVLNQVRAAMRAIDPDLVVTVAPLEGNLEWW